LNPPAHKAGPGPGPSARLIAEGLASTREARHLAGVIRIALVGSLAMGKEGWRPSEPEHSALRPGPREVRAICAKEGHPMHDSAQSHRRPRASFVSSTLNLRPPFIL
jgi:hypothetical protein